MRGTSPSSLSGFTVVPPPPDNRPRRFCAQCSKHILLSQFTSHTQRVHGSKKFACAHPGCGQSFRIPADLNTHASFECKAALCDYGASARLHGLLAHVRRVHPEIFANYVKGQEIPWNGPPMNNTISQTSSPIATPTPSDSTSTTSQSPEVPERPTLSMTLKLQLSSGSTKQLFKRQKLSEVTTKELIEFGNAQDLEEEMQAGYTEDIAKYLQDWNNYQQQLNPGLKIHTPKSQNNSSVIRICTGSNKDSTCPYEVEISTSTSRYSIRTLSEGKILQLSARCFLCTKAAEVKSLEGRLAKEKDGVPLCAVNLKCQNPRATGHARCQQCIDGDTSARLVKELTKKLETSTKKFGAGSTVKDAASMALCMKELTIGRSLGAEWMRCFQVAAETPSNIFIVDTETGFTKTLHEVGVITLKGDVIIDSMVNYGTSLYDFYKKSQAGLSELHSFREFCAINKSYGPPNTQNMPGLTANQIFEKLQAAGMNSNSIWIEHSFGHFDYDKMKQIATPDYLHILPRESNIFSTLTLWRQLFPGLFTHSLSHLFSLVFPDRVLKSAKRHNALPDAVMSRELLEVAVSKFRSAGTPEVEGFCR